jgi:hypothetical protein
MASDPTLVVVRQATETPDGWVVVFSALLDRGEVLSALGIARDGTPQGGTTELQRTSDHIAWMNVLPLARGALCVWAEETAAGGANILVDALDPTGKPRGVPMRVARGIGRWLAVSSEGKAALALVAQDASPPTLSWQPLDADGHPEGSPRSFGAAYVGSDVDAAPFRGGWVLGWTDRAHEDSQVVLASVDKLGNVRGPQRAFDGRGASSLIALASDGERAALAWAEPSHRSGDTQPVLFGTVSVDGTSPATVRPAGALDLGSAGPIELAPSPSGFALLAPARACWKEQAHAGCSGPIVPTFVHFGPALEPTQSEPLFVGDPRQPATLGWGLSCGADDRCMAFAAASETPTPVSVVDLPTRVSPFATPSVARPPADAPRLVAARTVATGTAFADLAASRLGDKTLVATLTNESQSTRRRRERPSGSVSVFSVDDDGQAAVEPRVLFSGASSVGGVSIAAGAQPTDGALLAWIFRGNGGDEVRLAHLTASARLSETLRLAPADGDASRVAVGWAGDGWLVVWVDGKAGGGQIHAAKIGRQLQHPARTERVTRTAVGPTDLALVIRDDIAWVAWSDARESPREGLGDIYATVIRTKDGAGLGSEVRVMASARHSRSPSLATRGRAGAFVAWIEDAPAGVEANALPMIACLDDEANVACPPAELPLAGAGQAASVELASAAGGVRAIIARSGGGGITLDGFQVGAGGAPLTSPWPLVDLDAPASFDVSFAVAGDAIFYADVTPSPGKRRIGRAQIAWSVTGSVTGSAPGKP